ncbi:glycoside hydrolase family 130 protein [Ancylomarina longa]|uniref:Glycosidase n=1 Tax=Ancylomarina longa TaxID=2487017 RepID=A0A434AZ25_9BACT|nr:glycoside hydrolase family 130 protein [Ancylomarina longa]RUT79794.1 glycosidase [Ancylomarina longa]
MNSFRKTIKIQKQLLHFTPDDSRVVTRFFTPGNPKRIENIFERILLLTQKQAGDILQKTLKSFSGRHRNIKRIFKDNFDLIIKEIKFENDFSLEQKLLIGSYFTMEYSIESAALFNPSIVVHPSQADSDSNRLKVILSFRAVGEGHISSIVFRRGIIKSNGVLAIQKNSALVERVDRIPDPSYHKDDFILKLKELKSYESVAKILDNLLDDFTFDELKEGIRHFRKKKKGKQKKVSRSCEDGIKILMWLANANYEIKFSAELDLSSRVIFPISENEIKGLEDARFVLFKNGNGNGRDVYYATYTAYNGFTALPQLIETVDFCHFKVSVLLGEGSKGKGMAIFPRKINGKFVTISRNDNENLYIMFSDNIKYWEKPILLKPPGFYWEFFQIGNCGSPIETEKGWLLLIHGVGPVRTYSISAILLDIKDPTKVIGLLKEPFLTPDESDRNGYVPNVIYSCGALIHQGKLILPYAMADSRSGIASLELKDIFDNMDYY